VFHFAAQTSVHQADANPEQDWRDNVEPLLRLLETCRQRDFRPVILFAGSVTQAGMTEGLPVNESHPDRPITVYDWHKLLAEGYLEHYARRGWARGATLRLANVYGPGPKSAAPDRGILNQIMRRAIRGESPRLYGSGSQIRDYLFVDDAVRAFLAAATHSNRISGQHFVVGSGTGHTLAQAFDLVSQRANVALGLKLTVANINPPAGQSRIEERNFIADTTRFSSATGWHSRVSLPEGIDITLKSLCDSESNAT
jgi:UDP-glucose 4-epimerase